MKIKSIRSSAAALCVSAFTLMLTTLNSQGGSLAFKNIFGMESASSSRSSNPSMARAGGILPPPPIQTVGDDKSSPVMARAGRNGVDDPANHNANDRRGEPQPGDDHGRHRGHGR